MFKNSLFMKIVLIFTLPVIGILIFSSLIVFEKQEVLKDLKQNEIRLEYLKNSERLIVSLEAEKILALDIILEKKSSKELLIQEELTNINIDKYNDLTQALPWKDQWNEQIDDLALSLKSLSSTRKSVLNLTADEIEIKNYYNKTIKKVINTLFLLRFKNYTSSFQQDLLTLEDIILSTNSIEKITNSFKYMVFSLQKEISSFESKAINQRNISLLFLFFCFFTLIPMFFILKNIIYNEQGSFLKIQKHKNIYELLNHANKFLTKVFKKDELYYDISDLLGDSKNLAFNFIFDLDNSEIIAREGEARDIVIKYLSNFKDNSHENLITKTVKRESSIIINDFSLKNQSVFYSKASELSINSMATFPIKKFDKVVAVLVLYSKEIDFFDSEAEILFDKLVLDITNCLEKIEYEDIRVIQEKELRLSSHAFDSSAPMIITDTRNTIVKANQAFCKIMGYTKEELVGENPRIFKSGHQDKNYIEALWHSLKINGSWSGDVYNKKSSGEIIALRSTITAIKNEDDKITNYLGQYMDISEQKDKEKILEYQATHDNLTGLPNRLLLTDRIEHAITKTVRHKIFGGLIFIDLDNFKEVNDTLGHDIGDILLITVAKKIKECVRDEDTVSRIGGDEFIVLLDNIGNNSSDARVNISYLAEKMKEALNNITHISGHPNVSTPSIGITLFSDASVSVLDIIKQADTAMYSAKKQGKNTIEFF